MSIITDPTHWKDVDDVTPPIWWQAMAADSRYWFYNNNDVIPSVGSSNTKVAIVDAANLPASLTFNWEIVSPLSYTDLEFYYQIDVVGEVTVNLGQTIGTGQIVVTIPGGTTSFYWGVRSHNIFSTDIMYGGVVAVGAPLDLINYNCECDDATDYQTLAVLRNRLMVRLGYAGQVNNPPPGMAALLTDFLQSSQRLLYMKYTELRTERFFTWNVEAGERLFDLDVNDGDTCSKRLNALKLTWVGMEDATGTANGQWYPLTSGIPPEFYTSIDSRGFPTRYEIRQCLEIFPVPDHAMRLRVKGHFELTAFAADGDQTTINSELVFMWALATAKAHYGHPDANNIAAMANDYLSRLVGGKHGTKRYIPGGSITPPWTKPVMRDGFDA